MRSATTSAWHSDAVRGPSTPSTVILTRSSAESGLRTWGLALKARVGFKRAAVAVARKLAVTMHAMLKSGERFDRTAGAIA